MDIHWWTTDTLQLIWILQIWTPQIFLWLQINIWHWILCYNCKNTVKYKVTLLQRRCSVWSIKWIFLFAHRHSKGGVKENTECIRHMSYRSLAAHCSRWPEEQSQQEPHALGVTVPYKVREHCSRLLSLRKSSLKWKVSMLYSCRNKIHIGPAVKEATGQPSTNISQTAGWNHIFS